MNRRRHSVTKNLKDYIVPIIGLFLIFILIISIFSGDDSDQELQRMRDENVIGYSLSLDSADTESYVVYPGDYKNKIEEDLMLYKGEKVLVKQGGVSLSLDGVADINLSKLGELEYTEDGSLYLSSSDLWVNSTSRVEVNMRYANVGVGANSTLSFSQNEMGSTVYLLSGFAEVENLAGETTVLAPGQKLSISRLEANKQDLDLQLAKETIDDYFQSTDWFIKNNGAFYLARANLVQTSTGETDETPEVNNGFTGIVSFDSLIDESQVSDPSIDITGSYSDETIADITINGVKATLDSTNKTFKFSKISTSSKENDLVVKVVDDAGDVLEKFVYTIYYAGGSNTQSSNAFSVKNFAVDATQFQFTSPTTSNIYSTTQDFITIRGKVANDSVASVTVNNYRLKSFNGSTWRYHASTLNDNLKDGTNIYEIKYFDKNNTLIYTNYFTISKKLPVKQAVGTPKVEAPKVEIEEKTTSTYSDEA